MNAIPQTTSWHERARTLSFRTQAFIDGRYLDAASGATFDTINPATGKLLARVAAGDEEDINRAVDCARAAFRKGVWANLAPAKRRKILLRFAEAILKHTEELALLETLDMGKPISDSLKIDIPGAARCLQWYAEAIDKVYDQVAPTGAGALALITREPMGVVGAIVPWNYPLLLAAWKLAAILEAGHSLVVTRTGRSARSRDAARRDRRRNADEAGAGLHRGRPARRRQHPRRWPPGARGQRRLLHRADGVRGGEARHDDCARGDLRPGAVGHHL